GRRERAQHRLPRPGRQGGIRGAADRLHRSQRLIRLAWRDRRREIGEGVGSRTDGMSVRLPTPSPIPPFPILRLPTPSPIPFSDPFPIIHGAPHCRPPTEVLKLRLTGRGQLIWPRPRGGPRKPSETCHTLSDTPPLCFSGQAASPPLPPSEWFAWHWP